MIRILQCDCRDILRTLPDESVHCIYAYSAGVIDSDGCIGIRRSTYAARVRGEGNNAVYSARVCCKQVTDEAVSLLKETFGGSLMIQRPSVIKGKPLFYWEIANRQAIECLRLILPYLRIKRAQAENCIALYSLVEESKKARVAFGRGHAGAAPRPAHITEAMERAFLRAKELNAVGTRERRLP